jgi:predicted HD superfamily hydrolase involved in NAD metabolism
LPEHRYYPFLKQVLTPRRLDHSLGVMQVMGELAGLYGLDRDKALTTGILHDAAKDLPEDQQGQLIEQGNIQIQHACESDYVYYLHGPVGAFFVQRELGIGDELVLDAIRTHTYYGSSPYFNDPVCWCLRFADILEPTRNWGREKLLLKGANHLRGLVYAGKLAEAAFFQTGMLIKWYESKGVPVHPNMERVKQAFADQLDRDEALFEFTI